MEAAELMEKRVLSVSSSSSLIDAASIMHEHNVRHLPIVEHNEVVGILSERDLRGFLEEVYQSSEGTLSGERRKNIAIGSVMQAKPITVDPSTDLVEVIDLMLENKIGAVVVTDTLGELRGIISYEDILRRVREHFSAMQ